MTSSKVVLKKAKRAYLTPQFQRAGVIARFRDQIDSASQRVGAKAQSIAAFVDFDPLCRQEFKRFEVAKAISVAIGEAIEQDIHPTQMKIVAQSGASDRELTFIRSAKAWADEHPGDKIQDILQVSPSGLLDLLRADQGDTPRGPLQNVTGFRLGPATVRQEIWRNASALDHHRWEARWGRFLGLYGKETRENNETA
jgi:hypothetical protein